MMLFSVAAWVEEMKHLSNNNPFILYKAQGFTQPPECDNLSDMTLL